MLELKREFVAGDLGDPRRAALPVVTAIGGMAVPALLFVLVNWRAGGSALQGWAIPTATDIAFALAVLAVVSTHRPAGLRTFLLTLAVVDDLLAIMIIAVFYTRDLHPLFLLLALAPLAGFGLLVQKRVLSWWLLFPLAVLTWGLVHTSGVHATVAGVLLAFTVPVIRSRAAGGPGAGPGMAEHPEHKVRPLSAGFAVPVFAFFAAGVTIGGVQGLTASLTDTIAIGIVVGLVAGKTIGVLGATYLMARFTRATLDDDLRWVDVAPRRARRDRVHRVPAHRDLAYDASSGRDQHVKVGVLFGSLVVALIAELILRLRNRTYHRICVDEERDGDADGTPDRETDVYTADSTCFASVYGMAAYVAPMHLRDLWKETLSTLSVDWASSRSRSELMVTAEPPYSREGLSW